MVEKNNSSKKPEDDIPTFTSQSGFTDPQAIGNYKILRKIGEGGMGAVYEAEQEKPVRRKVALKLIKWGMDTKSVVARFESERQALALMNHPSIAKVYDAGATDQGRPYFVMELVQGVPITQYCDTHKLTTKERLKLFISVCEAVQHAHQKGIIHRDIKASNVLVTIQDDKAVPKIIDFGVAKATASRLTEHTVYTEFGQLIGTPEYMSPEQAEMTGLDIDTRTDVYSLGVLLYELLVGALPFDPRELRKSGFDEIRRKIREEEPSRPSTKVSTLGETTTEITEKRKTELPALQRQLKGDLDWITMKALEKDRTRRYQSALELASDINRHMSNEPVLASPPSTLYRMRKFIRRHKVGVAAGFIVSIALIVGIIGTSIGLIRATKAEAKAKEEAETAQKVSDFLVGLFEVSDPSEARGNTITAREILDRGAEKIDAELSGQPLVQARMMHVMGRVFQSLSLYDRATPLLEESLAIRRRLLGNQHPATLSTMSNLGEAYRFSFRSEDSRALKKEVLETRRRTLGDEHPDTLSAILSLASAYIGSADQGEVEPLLRELLPKARRVLGSEHRITLRAMAGLGLIYRNLEQYKEAEELFLELLEIRRRTGERDQSATLNVLSYLVDIYIVQDRHDEAEPLCLELVEARRRIMGPNHHETIVALRSLASLRRRQGRFDESEQILREIMQLCSHRGIKEEMCKAKTANNLGKVYFDAGNYEEAALWFRRAVEGWSADWDPNLTLVVGRLASALMKLGRHKEATQVSLEHLELRRRTLGEENPSTLQAMSKLARLYTDQGRDREAEELYSEVLEISRRLFNEPPIAARASIYRLSMLYKSQALYDEAEALLLELLEIQRQLFGDNDKRTFGTLYDLGCNEALRGNREKALDWLRQAVENGCCQTDWIAKDPDLASLHGDPEFEAIVTEVKKRIEKE